MSDLFFQLLPASLSCFFCLYPLSLFSPWNLYYSYQRSINLSYFFSHACFMPLLSHLALCFTFLFSLFILSPPPLSSPLRFVLPSPLLSISPQWKGWATKVMMVWLHLTLQNAFAMEAWNKHITCNLCVRGKKISVLSNGGVKAFHEGEDGWKLWLWQFAWARCGSGVIFFIFFIVYTHEGMLCYLLFISRTIIFILISGEVDPLDANIKRNYFSDVSSYTFKHAANNENQVWQQSLKTLL